MVNGKFTAILKFDNPTPTLGNDERVRIRLELNKPKELLVVPVGGFYLDTKGQWMYVVDGNTATKRSVRLGRKNTEYFEVLGGLKAGEQVITSSYERLNNRDTVYLTSVNTSFLNYHDPNR